ncbi:MAG: MarR family winged helix-turn-helix transcriptional regulator [Bacteroidia bacterium]
MKIEDEIKQKKFHSAYDKLFVNIMYTSSFLAIQGARNFKPFGLTTQQYNVLRILRGQVPNACTVSVIQERMIDRSSNASRLIDKLVEKKLVDRKVCKNDRRQVDIRITESGLSLLKKIDPIVLAMDKNMKNLTEKEAETLSDLLDKIRG